MELKAQADINKLISYSQYLDNILTRHSQNIHKISSRYYQIFAKLLNFKTLS